jgi:hypothetical protein
MTSTIRTHFRAKRTPSGKPGPPLERWLVEDWPGCYCVNRSQDGTGEWLPLLKSQYERVYKDPMTQEWRAYG